MAYRIYYSCLTDMGKVRKINQDNFIVEGHYYDVYREGPSARYSGSLSSREASMVGVFDGMGGEECGEIASLIASRCALQTSIGDLPLEDVKQFCFCANDRICEFAADYNLQFMGTTAAIAVFAKKEIILCNIGDSKVFRFANGALQQISVDHYAMSFPGRKPPLSQNLGIPAEEMIIEPYFAIEPYSEGTVYLICSDGLTDMVPPNEIARILSQYTFDSAAEVLLSAALHFGGRDNVTIILCRVEGENKGLFRGALRRKSSGRRTV